MSASPPTPRAPLPLPASAPLEPPPDFTARLASLGVTLTDAQLHQLGDFLSRLLAMNESINLTAIVEPEAAWIRHGLDALSLVPHLADIPSGATLLDVGSGGGVPGIPVAIARPDLRVTLLDATAKKVAFLEAVAPAIGLSNVTATAGRAEDLARSQAGSFDVVTARAVSKISSLLPWTAPLAKVGGRLLFIKGEKAEAELAEASKELRRLRCAHVRTVVTSTGRVVELRRA